MKVATNHFLPALSTIELAQISNQVPETLALHLRENKIKKFTPADLWNIHRQRRVFLKRSF